METSPSSSDLSTLKEADENQFKCHWKNVCHLCLQLLENARTCLYDNIVSTFFSLQPPSLFEYFRWQFYSIHVNLNFNCTNLFSVSWDQTLFQTLIIFLRMHESSFLLYKMLLYMLNKYKLIICVLITNTNIEDIN